MEPRQFDSLTKTVATSSSRRRLFQGGFGLLLGSALARFGLSDSEAVPKKKRKKQLAGQETCAEVGDSCRKPRRAPRPRCCAGSVCKDDRCVCGANRQRCGKACITGDQCCTNRDCPHNLRCDDNRCRCPENLQRCRNRCIPKDRCCEHSDCPGDQRCIENECGCPQGQKLCNENCIPQPAVCQTKVTPAALHGWIPQGEDAFSPPALTSFVAGPIGLPIGTGSVRLAPQAIPGFLQNQTQAVLRTLKYAGVKISDITNLSYSINVPSGGDPPTLQLALNGAKTNEGTTGFVSLVFVPGTNGNPAFGDDVWTEQAPLQGNWFATRNIFGPSNECLICRGNGAPTGSCAEPGACSGKTNVSWATIQAAVPDAFLNGTSLGNGGFSFRIGRGDTGAGNLTAVVFNDDGYFFEVV